MSLKDKRQPNDECVCLYKEKYVYLENDVAQAVQDLKDEIERMLEFNPFVKRHVLDKIDAKFGDLTK